MAYERATNERILIHCASSFCWDALIQHIDNAIDSLSTTSPEELSNLFRRQLCVTDDWGNTALHSACYNSPPVEAIRAILKAASYIVNDSEYSSSKVTSVRSGDGSTPLLVACATGSSVEVLDLLLNGLKEEEEEEDGRKKDTTKSHDNTSVHDHNRGVEAATIPDHRGNTPLSELCANYETRLQSAWRHSHHGSNGGTGSRHSHPDLDSINDVEQACQRCDTFREFWGKVICILEGGTKDLPCFLSNISFTGSSSSVINNATTGNTTLLHKCAAMAPFCPPSIARLICRCVSSNAAQQRNEYGWLPLNLAIISEQFASSKPFRRYQHHSTLSHNRSEVIRVLLDVYPRAARITMPGDGRTPLCAAIASGLEWHLGKNNKNIIGSNDSIDNYTASTAENNDKNEQTNCGPLWYIWKHSPESHCSRDIITGLYPFMLAATSSSMAFEVNLDRKEHDEEYMQYNVDSIYSLLRLHPQLIQECIID